MTSKQKILEKMKIDKEKRKDGKGYKIGKKDVELLAIKAGKKVRPVCIFGGCYKLSEIRSIWCVKHSNPATRSGDHGVLG